MVYKLYKPTNITGVSGLTVGLTMIFLRPRFQTIFGRIFCVSFVWHQTGMHRCLERPRNSGMLCTASSRPCTSDSLNDWWIESMVYPSDDWWWLVMTGVVSVTAAASLEVHFKNCQRRVRRECGPSFCVSGFLESRWILCNDLEFEAHTHTHTLSVYLSIYLSNLI